MEIPEFIKIQGKYVSVRISGRGYIIIGETLVEMRDFGKKIYDEARENSELWEKLTFRAFEKCLKIERKRVKNE